jgi:phosphoketolase
LNFVYVHLNRVIKKRDLDMIYITGPGHGGPGSRTPTSRGLTARSIRTFLLMKRA